MSDEDKKFEESLRRDLPRGRLQPPKTGGLDRGPQARWLAPDELTDDIWRHEDGILLGKRAGRLIGWKDDRHLLTVAGSRAGKGVSLIIPNLIFYPGSAFVIDPKGENARITAGRRGQGAGSGGEGLGQNVHVIDPFGVSGQLPSSFNPLAELNINVSGVTEDAGMFADALIEHPDHGERHWTESAQSLIRALILVTLTEPMPERRNLLTVRSLLTLTDLRLKRVQTKEKKENGRDMDLFDALLKLLRDQEGRWHGDICKGVAEQLDTMGENELGSVLSSARTQTRWLDDWRMHEVLRRSDFDMRDLKEKPTTIYLCLPAMRMGTHARWLRLMIMLALSVMERVTKTPPAPVLFVLDEFPVLGHIQSIEMGAGLMAGFGVKLWTIVQDLAQLQRHYQHTWQTFVANSGVVTAFAVVDRLSAKEFSERLGYVRMVEQVASGATPNAMLSGTPVFRDDHFVTSLLAENEIGHVFGRGKKRVLILGAGYAPLVAERFEYFRDPMFNGLYNDPN